MPLPNRMKAAVQKTKSLPTKAKALSDKAKTLPAKVKASLADRKVRRTPTGFTFTLADQVDHLRVDHWDALTNGATVCLSRPFLRLLNQARPNGMKQHFTLIYRGEQPVAAVACQSLTVDGSAVPSRSTPTKAKAARDKGLARVKERILVCGNLLGWGPQGVAFATGEDPKYLWPAVAEALYRIRRADKIFGETGVVMVKDCSATESEADAALHPFSYRPLETEPNMVLRLRPEWDSMETYLGAMKSDYRSGIKKQIKEVEAGGVRVERLNTEEVAAHGAEIHALYHQVHDRQKLRLVSIHENWIPKLAAHYGDAFRTTVLRRIDDDKLLGFITTLKDRDGAIGYYIGFDKETASPAMPLYLRLLYALVEDAISLKAAWVSLGRTALEPKAKLGAKPEPLHCLIRHRLPAMNQVVKGLLQFMPEPAQPPARKPFKGD